MLTPPWASTAAPLSSGQLYRRAGDFVSKANQSKRVSIAAAVPLYEALSQRSDGLGIDQQRMLVRSIFKITVDSWSKGSLS